MGFIEFILSCPRETLFYDINSKGSSLKNPPWSKTADGVARWIRTLGIADPQLQPNHGWRRRFVTEAQFAGVGRDSLIYILGLVQDDLGGHGSGISTKRLFEEISSLRRPF